MAQADQRAVTSNFHAGSTGQEVLAGLSLAGRVAIVTGAYSGLGLETTRALMAKGVTVVAPARSVAKARRNLAGIVGNIQIIDMDLSDLASVSNFAEWVKNQFQRIDFLINNAGVMACPLNRVGPSWEAQLAINHLGHFALTQALMPLLQRSPGVRVISLSSTAHKLSAIRWDDMHFASSDYDKWVAYGQAKTANALFANALSRRLRDSGGLSFAVHPGAIFTPLQRHLPQAEQIVLGWLDENGQPSEMAKNRFKTPAQGCSTTLWAATTSLLDKLPGVYCEDCNIALPTDVNSPMARYAGVDAHACDDAAAERLWSISEQLLEMT